MFSLCWVSFLPAGKMNQL